MTKLFKFTLSLISTLLFTQISIAQNPIEVTIKGMIFNTTEKSISISQFQGANNFLDLTSTDFDSNGNFEITYTFPGKDYYALRVGQQSINIAITNSDTIKVYGDGSNLLYFTNIIGNDASAAMIEFFREYNTFNLFRDSLQQVAQSNPQMVQQLEQTFRQRAGLFQNYRSQFIAENPNSPALIATVQSIDSQNEFELYKSVLQQVIKAMDGSQTAVALQSNLAQKQEQFNATQFLSPGSEVPEIAMEDVNGKLLKLSDLKGQVVLLDFWASWCGPCRKENPNVVALYEKYKNAGFTVFSVSLDKAREPWLKAIEMDKLTWPYHISDLKGWSSAPAQLYKVSSIPFTLLLDKDGKVIQKNLRGPQLEQALSSIFGF